MPLLDVGGIRGDGGGGRGEGAAGDDGGLVEIPYVRGHIGQSADISFSNTHFIAMLKTQ